jgi:hypothetical protein
VIDLRPLADLLSRERGLPRLPLADPLPTAAPAIGALAASGPGTRSRAGDYALLVECMFEGYLLHYARGRVVAAVDPDLALLAGDCLYALGLDRLSRLEDLDAVAELADLISLCAQAHAEHRHPWQLTGPLWSLAALAVAAGAWEAQAEAKLLARADDPAAAGHARAAARARAGALGIESSCDRALIAFSDAVGDLASTT